MPDNKEQDPKRSHSMADHQYGQEFDHVHEDGEDADHDHDDFSSDGPLENNPIWQQDHVSLVGIDIGSSGTQVVFSRIMLRRMGEDLSSRYVVVSRETLFQSPVALTPYQSETRIDEARLGAIIDDAYRAAGLHPEQLAQAIRKHFTAFDLIEGESEVALAFRWSGAPSYQRVAAFAAGIVKAMSNTLAQGNPLYLILDGDLAHTLGNLLREEMDIASDILVVDGIVLWDFDYIDLGRIRMPSQTVPVTVKSLVFSQDPRTPPGNPRNDLKYRPHVHSHGHGHMHGHSHGHNHDHGHESHRHAGGRPGKQ